MSWGVLFVFLQNKSCFKVSLFCMRTDDWFNFHVKFSSIHVNITTLFFFYIGKTCQTQKIYVKLRTNAYIHVVCTHTLKKYIFCMLLTVSNLSDYWMSCETCVTIQRTSKVEEVFQYYFEIYPQHQKLTGINTCSCSVVFVWSWRKNISFHSRTFQCHNFAGRLFYSQVDEPS